MCNDFLITQENTYYLFNLKVDNLLAANLATYYLCKCLYNPTV